MVELALRGRKVKEPEAKPKNIFPYAALAGLAALIALIPFLGVLGPPAPSLIATGKTVIAEGPTVVGDCQQRFTSDPNLLSIFPVETNSKLETIDLDRNARVLTICVSGPDDSAGFSRILVPKDVLGEQVRVTLDDQPVNVRVQDIGKYNLVTLDYHHSERVIRITGEGPATITPAPSNATRPAQTGGEQQQQQQQMVVVTPGGAVTPLGVEVIDIKPKPKFIEKDVCPPENLTPESIVGTGIPVVFSSGERPTFTVAPDASGMRVQTKTRAIVNFLSDVGETVGVSFKIDNLSSEDSLVRVRVSSSDVLLVDLVESSGIDTLRPIKSNEYILKLDGGATKVDLVVNITSLTAGLHPFLIEILPLLEQVECI